MKRDKKGRFEPMANKEVMIDMIKAGTKVDDFCLFWHKEAGYTLGSARTKYYEYKAKLSS